MNARRPRPPDAADDPGRAKAPTSIAAWLDSRTGYATLLRQLLDHPVSGGARGWYVFGAVATFLVALEAVTGVVLAAYYAPSANDAWASVAHVQDTLPGGWMLRGLHGFGSSALIATCVLHLGQVVLFGAYKAPREVNWVVGMVMLGIVLLFAVTGSHLPWDQKAYAAKLLADAGGPPGAYALAHSFAVHAFVLPAALIGLLVVHVRLFRRHGVTPRWGVSDAELSRRTQRFWPHQVALDAIASAVTLAALLACVARTRGADLGPPADPAGSYAGRPEWYALPFHQLRVLFTGPLEALATTVIPGLIGGVTLALPFLDRSRARDPRRRPAVMAGAALVAAGLAVLAALALDHDASDPAAARARDEARERSEAARRLARQGAAPGPGHAPADPDPLRPARELWSAKCARCHGLDGKGGDRGPDLRGYNSRAWILGFLENPDGPLYMWQAKLERSMKPVEGTPDELAALTELVYSLTGARDADPALVQRGRELVPVKDCDSCHDIDGRSDDGQSENTGPNLVGRGTLDYVTRVIGNAGSPRLFGWRSKMPSFANKLLPEEITLLAKLVVSRESRKD